MRKPLQSGINQEKPETPQGWEADAAAAWGPLATWLRGCCPPHGKGDRNLPFWMPPQKSGGKRWGCCSSLSLPGPETHGAAASCEQEEGWDRAWLCKRKCVSFLYIYI